MHPTSISFKQACWYWLKLGFISFGGPAGQIAIMHHDLVDKKQWISEQRFLHALNFCMLLPGPEAQQLATYLGWLMHRTWGGIIAGALFVLPAFFILTGLAWMYMAYGQVPAIFGLFYGIKPAVVAIVLFAAYRIGLRTLHNHVLWAIAILAFIAIFVLHWPFPAIVLTAGSVGYGLGKLRPEYFKSQSKHGEVGKTTQAIIDAELPQHTLFSWRRFILVAAIGLALWASLMLGLSWQFGWQASLSQMAWFFSKAAMLTFGGAYAVLPYVYQGAVSHYHWLSPTQMIDGLALGESTPGPLVIINTFVGFVAGWNMQVLGAQHILASAICAALVVTFVTFLPSFVMIFLGAPFIETTHGKLSFTAPLTAITAAVVGVIVNLACFFAYHVFLPQGWGYAWDGFAVVLTVITLLALVRYKVNVIFLIVACGLLGMSHHLLGF